MKLYELCHQVNNEDSYIEFEEKQITDIFKFFYMDIDNYIKNKELKAFTQPGLTDNLLSSLDCVNVVMGIPVFSERFKQASGELLNDDIDFYPCLINNKYKYYACRIKKKFQLIDYEKSLYRSTIDGEAFLYGAFYLSETMDNFYIARDIRYDTSFLVSELFRDFVVRNKLKVKLKEVDMKSSFFFR